MSTSPTPPDAASSSPSFADFDLPPSIVAALRKTGFENATPIQAAAIPIALQGKDILGMAQTGTGKTGAFGIPMMVRLMASSDRQALVLAPTRELASQIHAFLRKLAGNNVNLRSTLIIGGAPMKQQVRELNMKPRVLVATPGRLVDHLNRAPDLLSKVVTLVLDEADRMLDMGFMPQLRIIRKALPRDRQTMLFSATYPGDIRKLAAEYLRDPREVKVGEVSQPITKIEQAVIETTQKLKNDVLVDELNQRAGSVLIFTRTKHRTNRVCRYLEESGYRVTRIHGDRTQAQRRQAIDGFRAGTFRILVATDIAARGLDITNIEHVINYDLPQVPEDYVHRIGRTARNGREGRALCLLTPEDTAQWRVITRLIGKPRENPREINSRRRSN